MESEYKDAQRFKKLVELGESALERNSMTELKAINYQFWDLLIVKPRTREDLNNFDGDLGLK